MRALRFILDAFRAKGPCQPPSWVLVIGLLVFPVACQRPQSRPSVRLERPLVVRMECHGGDPDRLIDRCFGEALRDRLSNQAEVASIDQLGAANHSTLVVRLRILDSRSKVVGNAALDGFTSAFGAGWKATGKTGNDPKSAIQDAVGGVVVGTLFGVVAAPVSAAAAETRALYHNARLGYKPRHVLVQVSLITGLDSPATPLFETNAFEVVKAMRPMKNAEAHEPGRLMKEEAFALAKVISTRLERNFGWHPGHAPRQRLADSE